MGLGGREDGLNWGTRFCLVSLGEDCLLFLSGSRVLSCIFVWTAERFLSLLSLIYGRVEFPNLSLDFLHVFWDRYIFMGM